MWIVHPSEGGRNVSISASDPQIPDFTIAQYTETSLDLRDGWASRDASWQSDIFRKHAINIHLKSISSLL